MTEPVLKIDNLVTSFHTEQGRVTVTDRVSLEVERGGALGIVGESGCGKSVTALSVMRLLPKPSGVVEKGYIIFDGEDILTMPAEKLHGIRGRRISMIFQEPMTSLNPVHRIGRQIGETFRLHMPEMTRAEIRKASTRLLEKVGVPAPDRRMNEYPHQLSGGMRQRVMIAMAIALKPDILIADEPTTALDVTIQAQILDVIRKLQRDSGMSIIFITHDLGVIAEMCDRAVVMYAGGIVERAGIKELFRNPGHPYTKGLFASIPSRAAKRKDPLTAIRGMVPSFEKLPDGCAFANRCPEASEKCATDPPSEKEVSPGHFARCHFSNL